MKLKFHTETKLGTLAEFLALAVRGTITSTKVSAPRRVARTVDGARFLREYPHIAKMQFAEDALTKLSKLL